MKHSRWLSKSKINPMQRVSAEPRFPSAIYKTRCVWDARQASLSHIAYWRWVLFSIWARTRIHREDTERVLANSWNLNTETILE